MKIRRFYGRNVRIALKEVTEEFGEDAAILSNKKVPGGVEIIAALDYDEALMPSRESEIQSHNQLADNDVDGNSALSSQARELDSVNPVESGSSTSQFHSSTEAIQSNVGSFLSESEQDSGVTFSAGLTNLLKKQKESAKTDNLEKETISDLAQKPDSALSKLIGENRVEWSMDPSLQAMREELELMRGMMQEQLNGLGWSRFAEKSPLTTMLIKRLSALGLPQETVQKVLSKVDYGTNPDAECIWQQSLALLAKSIPICDRNILEDGGVYALMGPTGVGKTTTIAKLAARFIIKHGADSVALITTDNYRISAFEQLLTFGKILRIPTAKVSENDSLAALLKKFSNKKLVLIDTAGVSANEPAIFKQFSGIQEAGNKVKPILLMSASSQSAVIQHSIALFAKYKPQGAIITKLDEAACLGEVLGALIENQLQVLFTTDGQRIPEDIRLARSHHLVSKAVWLASKFRRNVDDWALAQSLNSMKSA